MIRLNDSLNLGFQEDSSDPKSEMLSSLMKIQEPLDTRAQSQIEGPALTVFGNEEDSEGSEDGDLSDDDGNLSEESEGSEPVVGQPKEEKVFDEATGRVRRRAVFNDNLDDEIGDSDEDDENDDMGDDGDEEEIVLRSLTSNKVILFIQIPNFRASEYIYFNIDKIGIVVLNLTIHQRSIFNHL